MPKRPTISGRTLLLFLAKLVFSALLVTWALSKVDAASVYANLRQVNASILAISYTSLIGSTFLFAWRWRILSGDAVPFSYALRYTWVGYLFGAILPGGISGDLAKGASMALSHRSMRTAALPASILLDRIIGLWVLLVFFAGSCCSLLISTPRDNPQSSSLLNFAAIGLTISALMVAIITALRFRAVQQLALGVVRPLVPGKSLKNSFDSLWSSLVEITARPKLISRSLWVSLVIQAVILVQNWLLMRSLNSPMGVGQVVVVYICIGVATLLPVSISGIGIREWVTVTLFAKFGQETSLAIAYAWLILAGTLLLAVGGGLVQTWVILSKPAKEATP